MITHGFHYLVYFGKFTEEPQNVTLFVGQNHTVRCLYYENGSMSWKINKTIYDNRDVIPNYFRTFLSKGQKIIATSVMPYLNGTKYQCILSQRNITLHSSIGVLFVGKRIIFSPSIISF